MIGGIKEKIKAVLTGEIANAIAWILAIASYAGNIALGLFMDRAPGSIVSRISEGGAFFLVYALLTGELLKKSESETEEDESAEAAETEEAETEGSGDAESEGEDAEAAECEEGDACESCGQSG